MPARAGMVAINLIVIVIVVTVPDITIGNSAVSFVTNQLSTAIVYMIGKIVVVQFVIAGNNARMSALAHRLQVGQPAHELCQVQRVITIPDKSIRIKLPLR